MPLVSEPLEARRLNASQRVAARARALSSESHEPRKPRREPDVEPSQGRPPLCFAAAERSQAVIKGLGPGFPLQKKGF